MCTRLSSEDRPATLGVFPDPLDEAPVESLWTSQGHVRSRPFDIPEASVEHSTDTDGPGEFEGYEGFGGREVNVQRSLIRQTLRNSAPFGLRRFRRAGLPMQGVQVKDRQSVV